MKRSYQRGREKRKTRQPSKQMISSLQRLVHFSASRTLGYNNRPKQHRSLWAQLLQVAALARLTRRPRLGKEGFRTKRNKNLEKLVKRLNSESMYIGRVRNVHSSTERKKKTGTVMAVFKGWGKTKPKKIQKL